MSVGFEVLLFLKALTVSMGDVRMPFSSVRTPPTNRYFRELLRSRSSGNIGGITSFQCIGEKGGHGLLAFKHGGWIVTANVPALSSRLVWVTLS